MVAASMAAPFALAPPAAAQDADADGRVELPELVAESRRLDAARNAIQPRLGASVYELDRAAIERLPQGDNAPLSQVLLQAPGVVQDSFGDLRVRGDHRNLQYRVNGVTLPESIGGFGQTLDARSLRSVALITGALPAQFGYRTAGIIDLTVRSGAQDPGGALSLYGGSRGTVQPALVYGNVAAGWEYFGALSHLRNDQGIENPAPTRTALHAETRQWRGFGYAARPLDDTTRISLIAGTTASRFQIPNVQGLAPAFTAFGTSDFDSARLGGRQWERSHYGVAALQKSFPAGDVQVAAFGRFSSIRYLPDPIGDLVFNGAATDVYRRSAVAGVQTDGNWRLHPRHTLRGGFFTSHDATRNVNAATVLPTDALGGTLDAPFLIEDRGGKVGRLYGIYAQDEWRITDTVTLNAGARFDHMDQYVRASQLSPRLNAVWRPDPATTLSAGYARYFTPPPHELTTTPDLPRFAGTTLAPAVTTADPVRPERSHYFNLGANRRATPRLTLGVEAYYKQARDMQDLGQFGRALVYTPYNYRQGRVYGTEFSASWRGDGWQAYGNLAFSRSVGRGLVSNQYVWEPDELAYVEGKFVRTDHDQLLTGSAGASASPWPGGLASASLLYGSGLRRGFANTGKVDPYATVNLGLAHEFRGAEGGAWTVRLDVVNLFDRQYQLRDGTGIGVGAPQYGFRRGVFAGLSRAL